MNLYSIFRDATILGAVFLGMAILNHAWSANSTVFPTTAGAVAKLGQGRKAQPQDISCPCSGVLKLSRISG